MDHDLKRRAAAEFFGTFWLTFGGCGAAVLSVAFPEFGIGFAGVALLAGGSYVAQLWLFWLAAIAGALSAGALAKWLCEDTKIVDTVVVERRAA